MNNQLSHQETYNAASDKSVVASPLGVLTLLSLYASGAEGENRKEIVTYLGSSDYKQVGSDQRLLLSFRQEHASLNRIEFTVEGLT